MNQSFLKLIDKIKPDYFLVVGLRSVAMLDNMSEHII